jgi:hypothetical protein
LYPKVRKMQEIQSFMFIELLGKKFSLAFCRFEMKTPVYSSNTELFFELLSLFSLFVSLFSDDKRMRRRRVIWTYIICKSLPEIIERRPESTTIELLSTAMFSTILPHDFYTRTLIYGG